MSNPPYIGCRGESGSRLLASWVLGKVPGFVNVRTLRYADRGFRENQLRNCEQPRIVFRSVLQS